MADKEFLSPVTLAVLKLKNVANTFTNLFSNATTAARTWTLPDKSGTVALTDDVPSLPLSISNGGTGHTASVQTLQIVTTAITSSSSTTAKIPLDNTKPQNTEGTEIIGLATTITPLNASSTLEITVKLSLYTGTTTGVTIALFKDSAADAIGADVVSVISYSRTPQLIKFYLPATNTVERTYKIRIGNADGTTTVNWNYNGFGGLEACRLTIKEFV